MNDFVSSATGSCCDEQHRVSRKRLEWCPRRAVQRGESGCLRGLSGSFVDLLSPSSRLGKSPECRRHQPYRALAWMGSGAPTGTGGCAVFCCCLMIRVSAFIHSSPCSEFGKCSEHSRLGFDIHQISQRAAGSSAYMTTPIAEHHLTKSTNFIALQTELCRSQVWPVP